MSTNNNIVQVSASLYVGDLDPDVTETMLYEIFNSVAVVSSVRICRDALTRRSLGYAYVNYNSVADAERALDTLNFTCIRSRPCRIMWCLRDPASRRNNEGNVFVKNLDKSIDNKTLFDTFSLFGNIMSCKIATDSEGNSLGYGFIHFEHPESAKEAIARLNGMILGDRPIYVGKFQRKAERFSEKDKTFTNVYVKHIPKTWSEETLHTLFGAYGKISSLVLQSDSKGRPFGFVNFEDPESAKKAVANLHNALVTPLGVELDSNNSERTESGKDDSLSSVSSHTESSDETVESNDYKQRSDKEDPQETDIERNSDEENSVPFDVQSNRLYVSRAQKRNERQVVLKSQHEAARESQNRYQGVNLYVKNLSESMTESDLRALFEPYGTISSVSIKTDESGISRGFGFVSFLSPDEATKAITEMHLKLVRGKPLYVGLHERKEQRALRLQQRIRGGTVPPVLRPGAIPPGPPAAVHGAPMQFGAPPQMYFIPGNPAVAATASMQHNRTPMVGSFPNQGVMASPWRPNPTRIPYGTGTLPPQMTAQSVGYNPGVNGIPPNNGSIPQTGPQSVNPAQNIRTGGNNQRIHNRHMQGQGGNRPTHGHQVQIPKQSFKFPSHIKTSDPPRVDMIPGGLVNMDPSGISPVPMIPQNDIPLTANTLAAASPSMQKQLLGERLFPIIAQYQPELAGKITGMMLEMDNNELLEILNSDAEIKNKVDEAMIVLERAQ
ncbi:putative polyadenylate-binding protein [Cryptosporidium serpentis]